MASARKSMDKQREMACTVGKLWAYKKIMLMSLIARSRLVVPVKIGVKAEPLVEVLAGRNLPAACPLLKIAMQE